MSTIIPKKPLIPIGTRVQWRARYPTDPLNEGVVVGFVDRGQKEPDRMWKNDGPPVYLVDQDKRDGRTLSTPKRMRPIASALEEQNNVAKPPIGCEEGLMINQNLAGLNIGRRGDHCLPVGTLEVWHDGRLVGRIEGIGQAQGK